MAAVVPLPVRLCRDVCLSSFTRCPMDRADFRLLRLSCRSMLRRLLPSLHRMIEQASQIAKQPRDQDWLAAARAWVVSVGRGQQYDDLSSVPSGYATARKTWRTGNKDCPLSECAHGLLPPTRLDDGGDAKIGDFGRPARRRPCMAEQQYAVRMSLHISCPRDRAAAPFSSCAHSPRLNGHVHQATGLLCPEPTIHPGTGKDHARRYGWDSPRRGL